MAQRRRRLNEQRRQALTDERRRLWRKAIVYKQPLTQDERRRLAELNAILATQP